MDKSLCKGVILCLSNMSRSSKYKADITTIKLPVTDTFTMKSRRGSDCMKRLSADTETSVLIDCMKNWM